MNTTRIIGDTHKRYWISEYSKLTIPIPPKAEQKRIVDTIHTAFAKLDTIMVEKTVKVTPKKRRKMTPKS